MRGKVADVIFKTIHKTLHGKLSLILLGLLCLIGCLSVPLTLFTTRMYQQETAQNLNRPLAVSLASHLAERNLLSPDFATLQKARAEIKYLMAINPNIDVYVLDSQGAILAYSGVPGNLRKSHVALAPVHRFLSHADSLPILGDDPRTLAGQKVFSAAPFFAGNRHPSGPAQGYVYVILDGEHYGSAAGPLGKSYVLRSSLWVLVAILALVSTAGLLLFHLLTRRLCWLTTSMETFRDQDFRKPDAVLSARLFTPWPGIVYRRDEIDKLGMVHLEMTNRIRGQILALAHADTRRLEVVSNISHDLRTPLTALRGYLETLLIKEGQLTPQEQREYLQIATRHSERLAKLIGELFDLGRLDSGEVQVDREPFSLGELVQDVVQQYQLVAQQKALQLQALLSADLPFVYADIALIERVLDNLLENALRYTPEGGLVTLGLTAQGDQIEVRIADTGSGIRQEDLPHIFQRFYRVPGQPEKLGRAGLGLAIAKRILELHGSAIEVQSVLSEGTSFTFRLPIHTVPGT